jgi:hypothetical protein
MWKASLTCWWFIDLHYLQRHKAASCRNLKKKKKKKKNEEGRRSWHLII